MSNVIPMQMSICEGELHTEYAEDSKKNSEEIADLLKKEFGSSFSRIQYRRRQRVVTGSYETEDHKEVYLMVANLTFMGGKEGQHRKDLKRIQYDVTWREFYEDYSSKGRVLWLGLYSYKDINIWAFFEPETYLQKHKDSNMISKGGHKAKYSCHIYLNDLYQGYTGGSYTKVDKNKNVVGAVRTGELAKYLAGVEKNENPILEIIEYINNNAIEWNRWIMANYAIPYMKNLEEVTGFKYWKQNLWNGWYIEAVYSEYLHKYPSEYIDYIATSDNSDVKEEYKDIGLDLAFPEKKQHFVGDLKAVCEGYGSTLLNDKSKVEYALKKYKRIWFIIYIHEKKPGKTNDYEMVKWRNNYILELGEWDYKVHPVYEPLSAPNTPHSVSYSEMIIIELNEITRDKYFSVGAQWGVNSDGKIRGPKFKVSKKMLKDITDDSFVIYRFRPEKAIH